MPFSLKKTLADTFASNYKINKKAVQIKKSWDEVSKAVKSEKSKPKK